MQLKKIRRQM
ncbi:unnamed protein product, partial [Didymodactylos carnosus]